MGSCSQCTTSSTAFSVCLGYYHVCIIIFLVRGISCYMDNNLRMKRADPQLYYLAFSGPAPWHKSSSGHIIPLRILRYFVSNQDVVFHLVAFNYREEKSVNTAKIASLDYRMLSRSLNLFLVFHSRFHYTLNVSIPWTLFRCTLGWS